MNWYKKSQSRIPSNRMEKLIEIYEIRKKQAIDLAKETGEQSIQLSSKDGKKGAMINKSSKILGKWQTTWFDERGFYGDSTFDTKEEAVIDAFKDGFVQQKDLISEFSKDQKFQKGNEYTMILQIANRFGGKLGFEVMDAYGKGGVQAAKDKAQEINNRQQVKDNELV